MSRILIGSSNIYRFHKLITIKDYKPYTMVPCTNQEVWNVKVDEIVMEKGEVIVAVIENLICDAVAGVTDPEVRKITIEDVVGSYMAQIRKCALGKPEVKFALAQPTLRPKHKWYEESYKAICCLYQESIKAMGLQNVTRIDGSPTWSQQFESDGVHFTEQAGKVYVENLITEAEGFFNTELVDLEMEGSEESAKADEARRIAGRIATVEREIGQLNREIVQRRLQDSLVTARIREELDFISNKKRRQINNHWTYEQNTNAYKQ